MSLTIIIFVSYGDNKSGITITPYFKQKMRLSGRVKILFNLFSLV